MLPHLRKLRKLKRSKPTELESSVAKALFELEQNHKTLRLSLPRFHINTVKAVEPKGKKGALVVFYPLRYLMLVRKVQKVLTAELEKRFAGKVVLLVAQRRVTKRPTDVYKLQKVQRSTTSTAVFENILSDLLYPCDTVGRRWKCRTDGSKVQKVFLDTRDRKKIESRLPVVSYVYRQLTHRNVNFGFMWNAKLQQVSTR
jgi:small subunit ribosomal protein S7e